MELLLLTIAIVVLLVLRVPVAFAFLGPSLGYMWLTDQSVGLALRLIINAASQPFSLALNGSISTWAGEPSFQSSRCPVSSQLGASRST